MLPGKSYKAEDVVLLIRRRFWVVLVPFAIVSAGTAIVARRLPNQYVSSATILVVPQQVPEAFVRPTVSTKIEDRVRAAYQQVASRTRLERIIRDLDLYASQRRNGIMEDVIERMKRSINVSVVKADTFQIMYQGDSPKTVQKVTDSIATAFIDQNLKDREVMADGTNQFLEVQLEDARNRLIDAEKKLEQYKAKYSGQLPTQLESNLGTLQRLQLQVQSVVESINRDSDQRLLVQRQLADAQSDPTPASSSAPARVMSATPESPTAVSGGTFAQQLDLVQRQLAALQVQGKTDAHPDVQALRRLIRDLTKKADAEQLARPVSTAGASTGAADRPPLSAADQAQQKRMQAFQEEIARLDKRIADSQAEETRLRGVVTAFQQKVDAMPARESEMTELTRDYGTLQNTYRELLASKEKANIAANLERRSFGEQFRLLDPATLPETPISPNRPVICYAGAAAGLAIGLLLVALLEYRNSGFQTDDDVTRLLAVPVLAVVPLMQSDADRRRAGWNRLVVGLACGATVLVCAGVMLYTLVR